MDKPTKKKFVNFLSVRIDDDLLSIIERMAREDHRSVGSMVRHLLWQAVLKRDLVSLQKVLENKMKKMKIKP